MSAPTGNGAVGRNAGGGANTAAPAPSSKDPFRGYRGPSLDVMQRFGITVWCEVKAKTTRGDFEGLLLPRSETSDALHLVLKLGSGYNIGIRHDTILHLEKTGIGDAGMEHLKGLENLRYLNVYATKVSDAGLEHIKGLKNLTSLNLGDTLVSGTGLAHLKELGGLTSLGLQNVPLSDAGPGAPDMAALSSPSFFQAKGLPRARPRSAIRRQAGRESPCGVMAFSLSWARPLRLTNVPVGESRWISTRPPVPADDAR